MCALAKLFFLAVAANAAWPAQGQPGAASARHAVDMELYVDGERIGSPRIVLEEGRSATMTSDSAQGYSVRIRLDRAPQGADWFKVASEVYLKQDGRWTLVGTPEISSPENQRARVEMPMASGAGRFSMTARVTPATNPN